MVGLGEKIEEIETLLKDLRSANVDFVTIGQYMQPSKDHLPVIKYYTIQEFKEIENIINSEKPFNLDVDRKKYKRSNHCLPSPKR